MKSFDGRCWAVIAFVANAVLVVAIVLLMLLLTTADTRRIPGFGIAQCMGTVLPWLNLGGAIAAMFGAKRPGWAKVAVGAAVTTAGVGLLWMVYLVLAATLLS